ncbi:MAG: hypothetical protein PHO06_01185 [Clostridia bacterium]|jgi:hypothetical protein|nr:hypothetical protein [Clostridia bacterium]
MKVFGKSWTIISTKNPSSKRKILLSDNLVGIMKEYKKEQLKEKEIGKFVFGGNAPFADKDICKRLNLKK